MMTNLRRPPCLWLDLYQQAEQSPPHLGGSFSSPTRWRLFTSILFPASFHCQQGGVLLALHSLLEGWLVVSTYRKPSPPPSFTTLHKLNWALQTTAWYVWFSKIEKITHRQPPGALPCKSALPTGWLFTLSSCPEASSPPLKPFSLWPCQVCFNCLGLNFGK